MEITEIAPAFLKARHAGGPEGRMQEAALLRKIARANGSLRSKDGTPVIDRLMSKVAFGSSLCWYWIGHIDALGYGRLIANGENKAHRVSYKIFRGDIPAGMKVMHSCDTRCCVNPDHLSLGTQSENVADMMKKGRHRSAKLFGESNPMAKATNEIVQSIRAEVTAGAKQIEMARKYNLSPMAVSRIVRKESWK